MEKCIIFSGGPHEPSQLSRQVVEETVQDGAAIYAADSGADTAISQYGICPDVVFGDLDSINPSTIITLKEKGVEFPQVKTSLLSIPEEQSGSLDPSYKDETDMQLAIEYAIHKGARRIQVIDGISHERYAHAHANTNLLVLYAQLFPHVLIQIVSGNQTMWARNEMGEAYRIENIKGKKGDRLNLSAERNDVTEISTHDLLYPLKNETLAFGFPRGLSNVFLHDSVEVSFRRGVLLFIHEQAE